VRVRRAASRQPVTEMPPSRGLNTLEAKEETDGRAMHDQTMMNRGACHKRHSEEEEHNTPTWQRSRGYGQRSGARRKRASDTAHEKTAMVKDDIETYLVRAVQTIKKIVGDKRQEALDQRQELNMLKMFRLHQ